MVMNSHGSMHSHSHMVPTLMFTRLMLEQLEYLNRKDLCSDSSYRTMSLASSGLKTKEEHLIINIVAALLICKASTLLIICYLIINNICT